MVVNGLHLPSTSKKLGPMAQMWVLPVETSPVDLYRAGKDVRVCGTDCPARSKASGGYGWCYLDMRNPQRVWWMDQGAYGRIDVLDRWEAKALHGLDLRLGAWGDPAVLPFEVVEALARSVRSWTGYTSLWRVCDDRFRRYLCASVHTPAEYETARLLGWTPFRVRLPDEPLLPGEYECPASDQAGNRLTCATCGACNGWGGDRERLRKASATLAVHGSTGPVSYRTWRFDERQLGMWEDPPWLAPST